jgi:tetratricopeptide (TPR) repeat protein
MADRRGREASDYYERALMLFREVGDRYGEARCHNNLANIAIRNGDPMAAEAAYERALDAANSAHAVDLKGLASVNLGVLYVRRGQRELAGERFEQALDAFTASANEAHRLGTLYNMAHLARDGEDWATASAIYEQVLTIAGRLGQPDVELGARAGMALAALAVGARSSAEDAMRWIRGNIESRPDWWFQGRDLVDALRVRLAAERGDDAHALRLLNEGAELANRHDTYAAGYLIAECGPSLRRCGNALLPLIDQVLPEVERLGFASVAERLSTLRMSLVSATQAA